MTRLTLEPGQIFEIEFGMLDLEMFDRVNIQNKVIFNFWKFCNRVEKTKLSYLH